MSLRSRTWLPFTAWALVVAALLVAGRLRLPPHSGLHFSWTCSDTQVRTRARVFRQLTTVRDVTVWRMVYDCVVPGGSLGFR